MYWVPKDILMKTYFQRDYQIHIQNFKLQLVHNKAFESTCIYYYFIDNKIGY
jgi:hypothetical protein